MYNANIIFRHLLYDSSLYCQGINNEIIHTINLWRKEVGLGVTENVSIRLMVQGVKYFEAINMEKRYIELNCALKNFELIQMPDNNISSNKEYTVILYDGNSFMVNIEKI